MGRAQEGQRKNIDVDRLVGPQPSERGARTLSEGFGRRCACSDSEKDELERGSLAAGASEGSGPRGGDSGLKIGW